MNIDDDLGFTQLLGQTLVFPPEFLHLFLLRIASGLGAALMRGQTFQHASLPFAPPSYQVRRVQPFAPEQGTDAAGLSGRGICLLQDALFVFSRERPALGVGDHLWVRARLGRRLGRDGEAEEIPLIFNVDFVSRPAQ